MKNIKKANTPLYKFILPTKTKFDSFRTLDRKLTISFHSLKDMNTVYESLFNTFQYQYDRQLDILIVYEDCQSSLLSIVGIQLGDYDDMCYEKLEMNFFFDRIYKYNDVKEAIPYIREIKIESIFD